MSDCAVDIPPIFGKYPDFFVQFFSPIDIILRLCYTLWDGKVMKIMNIKEKCCCFTGHRIIQTKHLDVIKENLLHMIQKLAEDGITDFITGGALGFDTLAAEAVLSTRAANPDIRLVLALPCKSQASNWNKKDVLRYDKIMDAADEITFVSSEYAAGCMHKRNRFMCDHSAHCVFYMTAPRGGTAYTVKYALENELELHNIITE